MLFPSMKQNFCFCITSIAIAIYGFPFGSLMLLFSGILGPWFMMFIGNNCGLLCLKDNLIRGTAVWHHSGKCYRIKGIELVIECQWRDIDNAKADRQANNMPARLLTSSLWHFCLSSFVDKVVLQKDKHVANLMSFIWQKIPKKGHS